MPTTTYQDPAFSVNAIQARTNAAGTAVVDVNGRELRLSARAYTPGVIGTDSFRVTAAGGSMVVTVGSGSAFADLAIVGATAALGNYWILLEPASQNFTVPAANLTNPRIDQIYLIVEDGTSKVVRLGYRQGDAAASPAVPGPDSSWEGSLLLARINVAAGVTSISQGNIVDGRVSANPLTRLAANSVGSLELANDAVISDKIADGAVLPTKLVNGGITDVKVAGTLINSFVLLGGTTGSPAVGTGDAAELTHNVSIPANWNSWSASVTVAGRYSIVGSVSQVRLYIRPGSGGDGPFNDFDFTPDGNSIPFAVTLFRSGMTSTGSQTIALRGSKTGAGSVTLTAASMSYVVTRNS